MLPCHNNISVTNERSTRLPRSRCRRWRQSRAGIAFVAVAALLISTVAWLSLVFSGTTTHRWRRLKYWEGSPHSLSGSIPWSSFPDRLPIPPLPPWFDSSQDTPRNRSLSERGNGKREISLNDIVFGIAGSSHLWKRRREIVRLWWRPLEMRGHIWLEEQVPTEEADDSLPPVMVSEDISRFRYTNPTGHPSGLRISRILTESFRLGLPNVRWFVLGDDDTVFNVDNLVAVLNKYDHSEMMYIGSPSESHSANAYFSHSMAFGGGGIAISFPLAEALSNFHDECIERYPKLYGSDDRLHACITELGVPLTREHGFHQWDIRGNAHGLLSSHPIAPFISIHHVEYVDPFYPGLMFPNIVLPRELERSEHTYVAWNKLGHPQEFDHDTRKSYKSVCKKPVLFFLKDVMKDGNATLGSYSRAKAKDDLKRKVFCFPHPPPLQYVQNIQVVSRPFRFHDALYVLWQVPRRLCCKVNNTGDEAFQLTVGQCEKGALSSFTDSL
ncbi:hypothetical protein Gohar_005749 [Gossypium harknessii]|uniref:Uncharacterized protein n=1 Tax=Gossypium harknessii TaxID=34285 RepID=A0A7J9H8Y1_9ROSI|nr:hypothetical protein [Gossypium harknessii]